MTLIRITESEQKDLSVKPKLMILATCFLYGFAVIVAYRSSVRNAKYFHIPKIRRNMLRNRNSYLNFDLIYWLYFLFSLESHVKVTCLPILVVIGDQVVNVVVESFYSSSPYYGLLIWWTYHAVTTIICLPLLNTWICWEANRNFLEFRKVIKLSCCNTACLLICYAICMAVWCVFFQEILIFPPYPIGDRAEIDP